MKLNDINMSTARFLPKSLWPPDSLNKKIDDIFEWLGEYYVLSIIIIHVLYIALFFGFLNISPGYIQTLNIGIQLFIGLFLIFRFHPFRTHEYKKYDSRIIFGSGIFLLTNLGFIETLKHFIEEDVKIITGSLIKQ